MTGETVPVWKSIAAGTTVNNSTEPTGALLAGLQVPSYGPAVEPFGPPCKHALIPDMPNVAVSHVHLL